MDRNDPATENQSPARPRRFGLLFTLLSLLILVEVMTVFAVLASQRYATEHALREYSHELLKNVIDETRENAAGFLRRAQDSVALANNIFEAGLLQFDDIGKIERYFLEQLRVVPQIDALYYGDQYGNFVFSKRSADGDGFLTKLIQVEAASAERVTLIRRDQHLAETSRSFDPEDRYDPRERPWYVRAMRHSDEIWTDPYIFFTAKQPGVTVAAAVWKPGSPNTGVIGADIQLSALSEFLKTQRIGTSGKAFIIDREGGVLAHPLDSRMTNYGDDQPLRLKKLGEFDPVTAQAGVHLAGQFSDLSELSTTHFDKFSLDDRFYLSMFVPLFAESQNRWLIGVFAPEDELAEKIREGQRDSVFLGLSMSLLVITAAILIGLISLRPIDRLQREAAEDPLTGLLNRRSFDDLATRRFVMSRRQDTPLTAIMIDIDNFKPINDEHGHAVGDEVLRAVARRIRRGLSSRDLLARYGGEEFAILLPDTGLEQGRQIAERLRELVSASSIKSSAGAMHMTVSLGVAERDAQIMDLPQLLQRADQAMLAAKRDGRDQVMVVDCHPA
jgi:diguanylate cyclase (GGDEF)-like protein